MLALIVIAEPLEKKGNCRQGECQHILSLFKVSRFNYSWKAGIAHDRRIVGKN